MKVGTIVGAGIVWSLLMGSVGAQDPLVPPSLQWPTTPIQQIELNPYDSNQQKPADRSGQLLASAAAEHWYNATYAPSWAAWTAPRIRYQPLYFEDVPLERYGQTGRWPVVRSGLLFAADYAALPINARHAPPWACEAPLGSPRPGSPAACSRARVLYPR